MTDFNSAATYFEDIGFDEVQVSSTYSFRRDEVIAFARQWDPLPVHMDDEAARAAGFEGITASGTHMLAVKQRLLHDFNLGGERHHQLRIGRHALSRPRTPWRLGAAPFPLGGQKIVEIAAFCGHRASLQRIETDRWPASSVNHRHGHDPVPRSGRRGKGRLAQGPCPRAKSASRCRRGSARQPLNPARLPRSWLAIFRARHSSIP